MNSRVWWEPVAGNCGGLVSHSEAQAVIFEWIEV
jgi:hypothetical protein